MASTLHITPDYRAKHRAGERGLRRPSVFYKARHAAPMDYAEHTLWALDRVLTTTTQDRS